MWEYIVNSSAALINAHQAGINMFNPQLLRAYIEAWAESKVGK